LGSSKRSFERGISDERRIMSETKNDIAWERIFKKYRILEKIE
jgi:hypothetical protein